MTSPAFTAAQAEWVHGSGALIGRSGVADVWLLPSDQVRRVQCDGSHWLHALDCWHPLQNTAIALTSVAAWRPA